MFTVGVRMENGNVERTTTREFDSHEQAFAYAVGRQDIKRYMHFVVIDLAAPTPDWLCGGKYSLPRIMKNL